MTLCGEWEVGEVSEIHYKHTVKAMSHSFTETSSLKDHILRPER